MTKAEALVLMETAARRCSPPFPLEQAQEKVERAWSVYSNDLVASLAADGDAPIVHVAGRTVTVDWPALQVRAIARNVRQRTDGALLARCEILSTAPGTPIQLHASSFDLDNPNSRLNAVRALEKRSEVLAGLVPWDRILDELARAVLGTIEEGEPFIDITSDTEPIVCTEYIISPLVVRGHPVAFFGDPGVGKSYIALMLSFMATLPEAAQSLEFSSARPCSNVLYLDWEAGREVTAERIRLIRRGMNWPRPPIVYRRCYLPLAQDQERLRREIKERDIDLIIIDSLGPACGGNLMDADRVFAFFSALRFLNVSSILIGHKPKNSDPSSSTIYGSQFFQALSRSIWEIVKDQESGEDTVSLGFCHKKSNFGRLEHSLGVRMKFFPDRTVFSREDSRKIAALGASMSQKSRVLAALLRATAPMTEKQLAEDLPGIPPDNIHRYLYTLRDAGKVANDQQRHVWYGLCKEEQ